MADYEEDRVARYQTSHPDARWFPEANMGLFMHWGIHSVAGLQPSWAMIRDYPHAGTDKYPRERYYSLASAFDPANYDPEMWLRAASRAGFDYAVLTTKHHDGYTLWPSDEAVIGTHTDMDGRDLLEPFVEACRKCDMKVGFYYSFADWAWPGFPVNDVDFDHNRRGEHPDMPAEEDQRQFERFYRYTRTQIEELLTRYDPVDLLWFDGVGWRDRSPEELRSVETIEWIRSLNPGIVINNRWGKVGDYVTPECQFPESEPGQWWETCMITNGHWGYNPGNPLPELQWWVERRDRCNRWGGNFLPNVGPAPDGTMPDDFYERCRELEEYTK